MHARIISQVLYCRRVNINEVVESIVAEGDTYDRYKNELRL